MMTRTAAFAAALALASLASAVGLTPLSVHTFFVEPGKPFTVRWRDDGAGERPFVLRDTWGNEVGTGRLAAAVRGLLQATATVPAGYFEIDLLRAKQRFGIVSLPAFEGEADPFFAIDGALSWLVKDDAVRDGLIRALHRSGVAMERERLSWAQVNPAPDKWEWQAPRRYGTVRALHKKHGVAMLEMFHDAPAWTGRLRSRYPADLVAAARSWEQIAQHWRHTWGALEVWNEPDISFGGYLPGDQYASLVKTVAHALAGSRTDVPLVGGVFAHFHPQFLDACAANGMLAWVDAASFHTYGRAAQMEALIGRYRGWLRQHGKETMPLWLTECGRPWTRGPERPPMDQDAASALDITMKGVESRACGIARYFPFVYPYYEERGNNFGMMGKRATPLRSMAAYVQLVRVLAGTRYLGDLRCDDRAIQRARVFGDGERTVAVLYTGRVDAKATVPPDLGVQRIEGIDGRPLKAADAGRLPIPDGLAYVWLDRAHLKDRLVADTPAMKLWRIAQQPAPTRTAPSSIVLQTQLNPQAMKAETKGYRVPPASQADLPLRIRAFNLSAAPQELIPRLRHPASARLLARPGPARVPASGHADLTWRLDLRDAFAESDTLRLTVSTVEEDAKGSPPLVVDVFGEVTMAQLRKRYGKRIPLRIADLARWQMSAPGHAKPRMTITSEKHWRLDVTFGTGDPWVYPFFTLPLGMDLRQATAIAIRARCVKPAIVRVFFWEGRGVGYLTPDSIIPADGQWHAALIPFDSLRISTANASDANGRLDLGQVRRISVGMNSKSPQNTLEVSEALIISKE